MDASSPQTGLLVVHGIGEQHPLDTARKVVRGLERVYGDDLLHLGEDAERGTIDLQLRGLPQCVRLYDVHWAPLFATKARGSFVPEMVQSIATFPWLNRRHHLYVPGRPLLPVLLWTALLLPLSALAYLGMWGLRLIGLMTFGLVARVKREESPAASPSASLWEQGRRQAASATEEYTRVDEVLDTFAGDVFQYVGGSVPSLTETSDADRVRNRFFEYLEAARVDGCGEVQVLAHSLGTVVAFNALTGYRLPDVQAESDDRAVEVSRLWTIGSPLEKIAFFFPVMTQSEPIVAYRTSPALSGVHGDATRPTWVNFRNPLDPVAGRLRTFPGWHVDNRRVWAGGVGRSHVVYERNPVFLAALTESLFGSARVQPVSWLTRVTGFLLALVESVVLLLLLVVPIVLGALLLFAGAALLPWLAGLLVGLVAPDAVADGVKTWGLRYMVGAMLLALFVGPVAGSGTKHAVWRSTPT